MPLPHTSAVVAPGPHDVRGRQNSPLFAQPPSNLPTAANSYDIRRQIRLSRLRRTLLALQTPKSPPPPPQLCSRHVPEPGCTPRGRGGEKRTCSRPGRTTYLPLCVGLPSCPRCWATVEAPNNSCQREVGRAHGRKRAGSDAWMAGQGLFEPFPRHVTTHRTSVSRVRDAGGGGVTAAATPAIACIRHARGSAGRTTDLADSFGAGS